MNRDPGGATASRPIDASPTYARLVLVAGCPRSGTTWVASVLRRHPDAVASLESALFECLLEPSWRRFPPPGGPAPPLGAGARAFYALVERALVWPRPAWYWRWRDVLVRFHGGGDRPGPYLRRRLGLPSRTAWTALRARLVPFPVFLRLIDRVERERPEADRETKALHVGLEALDRYFAQQGGQPGQVMVEKTPSHLFHARILLARLPRTRLVQVVRDGRDVAVSMDHYQPFMPSDRRTQAREWRNYVEQGLDLAADPELADRVLTVRFEELKADPVGQIRRVLEHAGLESSPETCRRLAEESRIERQAHRGEGRLVRKGAVGDWRDELVGEDLQVLMDEAGAALERAGYGG